MSRRLSAYIMLVFMMLTLVISATSYAETQEEASWDRIKRFGAGDRFVIALIPEENIFDQRKRYKYIVDYLSEKLNLDVRAEILRSYGEICGALLKGKADAGFFGSFSFILTRAKAGIEPVARPVWLDGSSTYRGYVFVRKDSGIRTVEDMKGKNLVLVHKATTAGYVFQLDYFRKHGVNNMEEYFSKIYFADSHDASAWAVYTEEVDVGGGKNHIFDALGRENKDFEDQMLILAKSPEVPSNGLAVSRYIEPALKKQIRDLLLDLHKTKKGRLVLEQFGAIKFIETTDEDYAPLNQMIEEARIDLDTYLCED